MTDMQKRYFDARLRVVFQALESVCNGMYEIEGHSENVDLLNSALQCLREVHRQLRLESEGE